MSKHHDLLQERLKVLRNLSYREFAMLNNNTSFRDQFPDPQLFQALGGLVIKVKSRFESHKVLLETVKNGDNDGVITLAESLIAHIYMIRELLKAAGFDELSRPYASTCEPLIAELLTEFNPINERPIAELIKRTNHLPKQLRQLAPAIIAFWFTIGLAEQYARSIQLMHATGLARIVREITFPPEYQQAGLSILNYFSAVLADKYPNIPVTVSIKQEPKLVTLVITLPDGSQDIITKTLNDYGLVITGKMSAKELVGDDIKALALQQKLELAQLEVRQTRDLLQIQEQYSTKRVESLELEVRNLYALLSREISSREILQEGLLKLTGQMSSGHIGEQANQLLSALSESISERNTERTRIILEDIQTAEPALFAKLSDFFLQAATSGVIGNYVYDWLKILWPSLPK